LGWTLQWGSSLEFLLDLAREQGVTPEPLLNRPELPEALWPVYNAFIILNRARGGNMAGEQPLRVSEMAAYFSLLGETNTEALGLYLRLLSDMDSEYLAHQAKKAAK
jgi:hypothetical protein